MERTTPKKLTEKQRQRIWLSIVYNTCGCTPDTHGNMPCDNGAVCDRCSAPDIKALYEAEIAAR